MFAQLLLLSIKNKLSMEKVLSYSLIPVPASMATFDGVPAKTDKSALMHAIEQDSMAEKPKETNYVIDGNALLQSLTTLPQTCATVPLRTSYKSIFGCTTYINITVNHFFLSINHEHLFNMLQFLYF